MKKDYRKYSESSVKEEVTETNLEVTPEVIEETEVQVEFELNDAVEEVEEVSEVEETEVEEVEEVTETSNDNTLVQGVVIGCSRLNVRKEASKTSEVVCVITNGNEVTVDLDASTEDFYKINACVNDVLVTGYCVKEFISIK